MTVSSFDHLIFKNHLFMNRGGGVQDSEEFFILYTLAFNLYNLVLRDLQVFSSQSFIIFRTLFIMHKMHTVYFYNYTTQRTLK